MKPRLKIKNNNVLGKYLGSGIRKRHSSPSLLGNLGEFFTHLNLHYLVRKINIVIVSPLCIYQSLQQFLAHRKDLYILTQRLQIQIFTGPKTEIKTIEIVGWSCDTCEQQDKCEIPSPPKGGATTQIQAIIAVLECKPSVAKMFRCLCEISQVSIICNELNLKKLTPPHITTTTVHHQIKRKPKKTCSQTCHGWRTTRLGLLGQLFQTCGGNPSPHQTVVIYCRYWRQWGARFLEALDGFM